MIENCKCGKSAEVVSAFSTSFGHGYMTMCHGADKHVGPMAKTIRGATTVWNRWMRKDLTIDQIYSYICSGIQP